MTRAKRVDESGPLLLKLRAKHEVELAGLESGGRQDVVHRQCLAPGDQSHVGTVRTQELIISVYEVEAVDPRRSQQILRAGLLIAAGLEHSALKLVTVFKRPKTLQAEPGVPEGGKGRLQLCRADPVAGRVLKYLGGIVGRDVQKPLPRPMAARGVP